MVWLIQAFEITLVNVQVQGYKGMSKSAIINNPSDPSLNLNLGCNLKHKPGDYRQELFPTVDVLRYLKQKRTSEDKQIGKNKSLHFSTRRE